MKSAPEPARLRRLLLAWYDRSRRTLPWRADTDPYRVWVAEVMLQQTRVATVQARWPAFLERFPDLASLARASAPQVCEAWAGLGYYHRALHLHAAAVAVQEHHGGKLPANVDELRDLPGIGAYTAGAIASIAFGRRTPALDGNAQRVLSRVLGRGEVADARQVSLSIGAYAEALVDCRRPGDLNQALMDLGAMVCTPRGPGCGRCPWRRHCHAAASGRAGAVNRKPGGRTRRELHAAFALLGASGRGLWLERRSPDGLWAGLWEPPGALAESPEAALARLRKRFGRDLVPCGEPIRHLLTHLCIRAQAYRAPRVPRWRPTDVRRLFGDPATAPLSALARKVIVGARQPG